MSAVNDYSLGEVVHAGTETRVQRAIHRPSGDRVVLKLLVAAAPTPRQVGRLLHEHEMLVKLAQVPGVARARALEQMGGTPALVLENSGFRSLDRVLAERGRLPLEAGLRLGLALARVLSGVHTAGVMHKDVKPQNVLVNEAFGEVVLVDFGIASWLSEEATAASIPESLEGTLAYISPEQTGRTARALDARTDLYSLGVLLFEVLSGRRPFVETDALALVHAHLAKAPPSLESVASGVPSAVAQIVERCLEKHPEKRYQTARGLAADLERCLAELGERGSIESFAPGQKDFSPTLKLPQALVSREEETEAITAAFERASQGAVEVLLLGGPSGVGKTALVRSVYREIAKAERGLLLSGKHDQLGGATPYAALAQAFRGLINNLAASPGPVFEVWRERLARALGPLARIIADLVPELEWLMGPLPALPVVPAEMTYNRLKLAWIEFVRAVTDMSPPLVLFLDDMQWVDPASLALLKTLLTDVGRKHLLVIVSYRDNEAGPSHPLWKLIEAVEGSGVKTPRLRVGPLSEASVEKWLAEALSAERERVTSLAGALHRKTQGSPFFLGQLLLELYRQKRVRRNLDGGAWEWDQDAVERAAVTDNVVELMRGKVVELPLSTQELLGQAACAGHTFSLGELSILAAQSPSEVVKELWPALSSGLVIPSDGQYREAQALAQAGQKSELDAGYRFLHDRVQQAFYERVAPEQRARTHLLIGRRLQKAFEEEGGSDQKLLEFTRQLNLGAGAISSEGEQKAHARLNLRAAKAAKAAGSYRLQASLVEQAQALLGARAWQEEPELSVELALERIEADYMLREFDEVHRRAEELLSRPLPALPRLAAQELRVRACTASGQYGEGERLGLSALAEQGIIYPESNDACIDLALRWLRECNAWLDQHPEGFGTMPAEPSPEHLLCDAIEAAMMLCAGFGSRVPLAILSVIRNIRQVTERRTLTPVTPFLIAILAHALAAILKEYRDCVRWVREGERAATRLASPLLPECSALLGQYLAYDSPVEQCRVHYQAAVRAATASGSFQGTSWGLHGELCYLDLWAGRPLDQVAAREEAQRDLMARAGDAHGHHHFALAASYITFLRASRGTKPIPEQDWLTTCSHSLVAMGNGFVGEQARILETHLFLAFGEHARALERAEEAERFRPVIAGITPVTDIPLWRGLSAAKCWSPTLAEERCTALLGTLEHAIERFRYLTEGCAENFLHKLCLLEAEHARIHGKTDLAMTKYEQAIHLAYKEGFLHIEALAAQFSAEFHLQAGRQDIGALYLHKARDAYRRWDALALVAHLEASYPDLLQAPVAAAPLERTTTTATTTTTDTTGGTALDVNTAVRAAQALSGELDPERVVGRLMELLLANAGAQRGALVLRDGEALSVVARLSVDGARIETGLSEPLLQSQDVAPTVVQYVARTGEAVIVDDAKADAHFGGDPYLGAVAVRSVLGLPLTHRGHLVGVLYLEHRETPSAFSPARISLLSVLASQAAIAVENAFLYRDLEAKVAQRTAEYKAAKQSADAANKAKSAFLASMSHELRTPLNGILGYAQILLRSAALSPTDREGVRIIQRSGEHLLTLIDDVLDLAKIEAGKTVLSPKDFSLSSFVQTVVNIIRVRAEQKGLAFHVEQRGPAVERVHADEKRLLQVLLNLLGNAIKFTERGAVTLCVHVDEHPGASGERDVRFQVLDTGPGIAPAHLPLIFLPFEQVGSDASRAQGTGLGLSICSKIVELMGGRIRVESEVGKGSLFEVTLPLWLGASAADMALAASVGEVVGYAGERKQVLVVDDKKDNRAVLRDLLAPLGFEVSEAASGEEALLMAASLRPAAVVMDLAMPGMDGYETTQRMRKLKELSDTVVIASSASFSQGEAEKSREAGCQDFLPKPVQVEQLLDKLGRALHLTWVREAGTGPNAAAPAEAVLAPPLEDLELLLGLANRGRLGAVREQGRLIEQQDGRYAPWVAQLHALTQGFDLRKVCAFIRLHAEQARGQGS